jgi:nitric oxide reductase activation protein
VEAKGGVSTYFADAISQAQTQLVNAGRPNVQKVIILLSDGEGNTYTSDPCQDGINAAGSATAAGTWVYAIAYGSSTTGMCTPATISGYDTMYRIASDPAKFFYQPDAADLTAIFQRIAIQLTTTRLLNDSTQ